jgi:excisionase family DNA binding protein
LTTHDDNVRPNVWITLGQAANRLGVHPATLRRWADEGRIATVLTPGGHRRFREEDLRRFARGHNNQGSNADRTQPFGNGGRLGTNGGKDPGTTSAWAGDALRHVRDEVRQLTNHPWQRYSPEERSRHRQLGQRLMTVATRFASSATPAEEQGLLREARDIGCEQGRLACSRGLSLTEALASTLFFRDALLESTLRMSGASDPSVEMNGDMVRRVNALLNVVQLAIGDAYDQGAATPQRTNGRDERLAEPG